MLNLFNQKITPFARDTFFLFEFLRLLYNTCMTEKKLYLFTGIFILAFLVQLIGLNRIGRTWDEQYKVDTGYVAWDRVLQGDFSLEAWNQQTEHPMVAKYIYGLAERPEAIALKDRHGSLPISDSDLIKIETGNYVKTIFWDKLYVVPYDYTLPRIVSALANAFAVLFTVIFMTFFIENLYWCLLPGVLLILTPNFVYLGQLVTFESLSVFFFILIILQFTKLLSHPTMTRRYITVGLLCGLFFWIRYNNIIIFPLLAGWLGIHYYFFREKKIVTPGLLLIPLLALTVGFLIWPFLWHNPLNLLDSFGFHEKRFVGISFYYWKYFFVTTPLPFLLGIPFGIYFFLRERAYWHITMLWFLSCIILIYSVLVIETGGTRYAVILYPLLAITAGYGYYKILGKKYSFVLIFLIGFMLYEMTRIFPYYLDYYNQLTGGATGAIKAGYQFSWWGEGQKEASEWVNSHLPQNASLGLIVTPKYVYPYPRADIKTSVNATENNPADYIVLSRTNAASLSKHFYDTHTVIYRVMADHEWLVEVLKKTSNER